MVRDHCSTKRADPRASNIYRLHFFGTSATLVVGVCVSATKVMLFHENMRIDTNTALIVCTGPSLDALSRTAWPELCKAGAIVAVNGALMARASIENNVRFTHVVAMSTGESMEAAISGFLKIWRSTSAWRLAKEIHRDFIEAESYIRRSADWSDDYDSGFFGGSSAMASINWLHNDWPHDAYAWQEVKRVSNQTGKAMPRRGYRRFVLVGLDMISGAGGHAQGAGFHASAFAEDQDRDALCRRNWGRLYEAATTRGSDLINISPGTGLQDIPSYQLPPEWLIKLPG
jgi:hypothetical protein